MANIIVSKTSLINLAIAMGALADEFEAGKIINIKRVETCVRDVVVKYKLVGKNVDYNKKDDNVTRNGYFKNTLDKNIQLLVNYFSPGRQFDANVALLIINHMFDSWICFKNNR